MTIENVTVADAAELLVIYAPYVSDTAVSFEYEVPTLEEFSERIRSISAAYPYIKAVENGRIIGYAYAGRFHARKAYEWSAESTIYVRKDARRCGVGRALYETLERELRAMGILNMNACIAAPRGEDAHLTEDSIRFHTRMGFDMVGRFHCSGYKFNTWYDMVYMEKLLGEHTTDQEPVTFK